MFEHVKAMTVFAVVVDEGSFRKAATKLSLSPSVVSQYISQLELHLGTPLFYRSTRKLSLTDYGKQLYPSCQQMMYWAETGLNCFNLDEGEIVGKLCITLPAVLIDTAFPKLLAEFCTEYPHIELTVNFDNQRHNIIEEGIDLALRIGWLEDSNLKAKKVMDVYRVICATQHYLANNSAINTPKDLESHRWVRTEMLFSSVELTNTALNKAEKFTVKKGIIIKGANAFKDIVQTNFGLAMGPRFLIQEELDNGSLVEVLPNWKAKAAGMYFVWVDNKVKNPLVGYFTDFMIPKLKVALRVVR
ncbi:LysR family transcriptional regulator [uncultured Vibrio sp.]|uniref:LysR family transcriptional regulator n=1 Tax=uncultured Vibrio sp. TaxID=114054 RepID=UPI00261A0969|nr:LysR family transcriptional regulator [uncultured Vibrio sp.]